MAHKTLYNKIWDQHAVQTLPNGDTQLFIGLHYIHEVTSPQAFAELVQSGESVAYPERTIATADHIVPTQKRKRPFFDEKAEIMIQALQDNVEKFGIPYYNLDSGRQGIVHVIGPELGYTQPGMTIVCGDSHTSTHGAFGSLAFGIGTTQIEHVLATQTLALPKLKVCKIEVSGILPLGVYAKDVILKIIQLRGVHGGIGHAYEYTGSAIQAMSMDERMTICNMSIEGGARIGYVNPDATTYAYMRHRPFAPTDQNWDRALQYWHSITTEPDAVFDDYTSITASDLEPMVTWGINPSQSVGISEKLPEATEATKRAYDHMKIAPNTPIAGTKIDVAFIGSCTNARLSDLQIAAQIMQGKKIHPSVRCLVVPGSQSVYQQAVDAGLDTLFINAGAEWREPGCSMCLAMNTDKLVGDERCASSSNRNFIGRQGSVSGRTFLMSPAMVAVAALTGEITDCRPWL